MLHTTLNLKGGVNGVMKRVDRAQKILDREVIRRMKPYTPNRNSALEKAAKVVAPGTIMQHTPYARYQYHGRVYTTKDGRCIAGKYEKKPEPGFKNGEPWMMEHSRAKNMKAGPKWFDRMKEENTKELMEVARRVLGGKNT